MNKKQRWILFSCAAIIALMLLFPPFYYPTGLHGPTRNMGYAFLFNAPESESTVNIGTLLVQWIGVLIVGAILWFAFRDNP
ncbi:MAG: hypothetical protein A4E65_00814 [Syntrophorhabdus sp. PtaU1.Bin153]|nr:MAG: hypothetical protein A4E65_00814 [Syntrophorhabdus sp. PtaU1.Bin153]